MSVVAMGGIKTSSYEPPEAVILEYQTVRRSSLVRRALGRLAVGLWRSHAAPGFR